MNININLNSRVLEKLVDYVASGIGGVAGPMLVPWKARKEAEAKGITAQGEADALGIIAKAQHKAQEAVMSQDSTNANLDITDRSGRRVQFQEEKRHQNIESVVKQTVSQLGVKDISNEKIDHEKVDHDWTADFFNKVQDVSSEKMQVLWAKVLAGEVERSGSTSIRTLGILKNLDQRTAQLFRTFCACAVYTLSNKSELVDARVPTLGGYAGNNSLEVYGLNFFHLNRLNEYGLVIPTYDTQIPLPFSEATETNRIRIFFHFQDKSWSLISSKQYSSKKDFTLNAVAMTGSGRELSKVIGIESEIETEAMKKFRQALINFFQENKLQMCEIESGQEFYER